MTFEQDRLDLTANQLPKYGWDNTEPNHPTDATVELLASGVSLFVTGVKVSGSEKPNVGTWLVRAGGDFVGDEPDSLVFKATTFDGTCLTVDASINSHFCLLPVVD